jgi:hypothetical protein
MKLGFLSNGLGFRVLRVETKMRSTHNTIGWTMKLGFLSNGLGFRVLRVETKMLNC